MMTREELRANVDGIAFMTVTPFHENGEVDYDGYRERPVPGEQNQGKPL